MRFRLNGIKVIKEVNKEQLLMTFNDFCDSLAVLEEMILFKGCFGEVKDSFNRFKEV